MKDASQRRLLRLIVTLLVIGLIGGAAMLVYRFQDANVLRAQKDSSERSDCSRQISDTQQAVRDRLEFLRTQAELAGYRNETALVTKLTVIGGPIDRAIDAVQHLPAKQKLVARTCPAP